MPNNVQLETQGVECEDLTCVPNPGRFDLEGDI